MIQYMELATVYLLLSLSLQINLAQSQRTGDFSTYGSNYVPYLQSGASYVTAPVQYVPAQGSSSGSGTYPIQNTIQTFEQYPPNGPYPSFNSPIYSNTPTISYQGLDEANALRSAYPNQPIIIINNGGNGDTGGNSNNGNVNGRRDNGFNLGDLAAIFLATRHKNQQAEAGGEGGPEPALERPASYAPPATAISQEAHSSSGYNGNNKCNTVMHITIVLPSSSGTVSVEQKNKKEQDNDEKKMKKVKCKAEENIEEKVEKMSIDKVKDNDVNKNTQDKDNSDDDK